MPKPYGRLLDEKLASAKVLFGEDLDLTSGSALRKILELVAMEEARAWDHLGRQYESGFVSRASGEALSLLGAELGIPRPHHRAEGSVELSLEKNLPAGTPELRLSRGTRLLTAGGHDYFIDADVLLSNALRKTVVTVRSFHPGPEHNLDPSFSDAGGHPQRLERFHPDDGRSAEVRELEAALSPPVVSIKHGSPTTGGELYWDDERYRDLLLAYPRNLWTADAVRVAVALVPGVRQVQVKDKYGGLDIHQAIFGNFGFIERVFSEERSLGSPYYVTILVAKDVGAIWDGPGQLHDRIEEAVDRVRPIGIHPNVVEASDVAVSFLCNLSVDGLPVPVGTPAAVDASPQAAALKGRIADRVRRYVSALGIGEPVRFAEVLWAIMEEPGVVDCKNLRLRRFPAPPGSAAGSGSLVLEPGEDVQPGPGEIAVLVPDPAAMVVR